MYFCTMTLDRNGVLEKTIAKMRGTTWIRIWIDRILFM